MAWPHSVKFGRECTFFFSFKTWIHRPGQRTNKPTKGASRHIGYLIQIILIWQEVSNTKYLYLECEVCRFNYSATTRWSLTVCTGRRRRCQPRWWTTRPRLQAVWSDALPPPVQSRRSSTWSSCSHRTGGDRTGRSECLGQQVKYHINVGTACTTLAEEHTLPQLLY